MAQNYEVAVVRMKNRKKSHMSCHISDSVSSTMVLTKSLQGTDLAETDRLRNIDRRCLKEAQGVALTRES